MKIALIAIAMLSLLSAQSFEVASVRPHKGSIIRSGPLLVSSSLIRLEGYTVFGLAMDVYNVRAYQLSPGTAVRPEEIAGDMYDIVARAPGTGLPGIDDVRAMLRDLLAGRFRMVVHRETREMPVYELVAGKNSPRLKAGSGDGPCSVHVRLAKDGRNNEETFSNCGAEELADRLENLMGDRPVLDRTGLTGKYDFSLVAIPEYRTRGASEAVDLSPVTAVA
jgi:uncharacterized protein (TIGR03435 family)